MRLAFMGSPDFAVPALRALHAAGHDIAAVYCQPPRPAGRGQAVQPCPVQVAAEALGLTVRSPVGLRRDEAAQRAFAALALDVAVVAAYGLILPQAMLDAPVRGCLNIHASLLPRWRGAAPIHAAVRAGDAATGITIMQMEAGLDSGPMLLREAVPIGPTDTTGRLHDVLAELGARLVLRALEEQPTAIPQPAEGVTYAPKLTREDGRIDWTQDAAAIERQMRAYDPWPGTFTTLAGATLKVLGAEIVPAGDRAHPARPGTVLDTDLTVACGQGALRLTRVQRTGRAAMDAPAFLRGHPVASGVVLGDPVSPGVVRGGPASATA